MADEEVFDPLDPSGDANVLSDGSIHDDPAFNPDDVGGDPLFATDEFEGVSATEPEDQYVALRRLLEPLFNRLI